MARDHAVVVGASTPDFAKRKVLGIRQLDAVSRNRLLDDLSGVDRSESSLTIADVSRVAAEKVGGISVAFLVCGSSPTPSDLRMASVQFPAGVEVVALDRSRLLRDVANALSDHHVNILSASVSTSHDRVALSRFVFEMAEPAHLSSVLSAVRKVDGVYDVYRITGTRAAEAPSFH